MKLVEPDPSFFGRRPFYCTVRPRYSGGSPAMVKDDVALRVAEQEREEYERALTGVYGDHQKRRAKVLGLRDIAYALGQQGSGRKFRWLVFDLVTGEYFHRHNELEIERLGYRRYQDLPVSARQEVNQTRDDGDYDRTYWKFNGMVWVPYEPELVTVPSTQ